MCEFTAVFEQSGEWWVGWVEEVPGAISQERTLEEVRESLKEAVQLIFETNREYARRDTEGRRVIRERITLAAEQAVYEAT